MSAQPHDSPRPRSPFLPAPDKSLRAIREALLPGEKGDFDREFRAVMAEVTETLDLAPLQSFIERWWRVAWLSADPDAHREMLKRAHQLIAGEPVATKPWAEIRVELGL